MKNDFKIGNRVTYNGRISDDDLGTIVKVNEFEVYVVWDDMTNYPIDTKEIPYTPGMLRKVLNGLEVAIERHLL